MGSIGAWSIYTLFSDKNTLSNTPKNGYKKLKNVQHAVRNKVADLTNNVYFKLLRWAGQVTYESIYHVARNIE